VCHHEKKHTNLSTNVKKYKNMKKVIFLIGILSFYAATSGYAQTLLINQEWVEHNGQPDAVNFPGSLWEDIDWNSSTTDNSGNLLVVGNTLVAAGNTDILTTKYSPSGAVVWQQTFGGGANGYDYGVTVVTDPSGNVYVAGVTTGVGSFFNITVLKYTSSGVLSWSREWNGPSNLYDVPTVIKIDNAGNVFVAGGTYGIATQTDFVLLSLNANSGAITWSATYDYAGKNEVATNISLGQNVVSIEGFSSPSNQDWDYAKVDYKLSTGQLLGQNRVTIPGLAINEVFTMASSPNGQVALAGVTVDANGNKNIQIVKIGASLGVDWIQNFDAGFGDVPKSVAFDSQGNIIVACDSENANGGQDIFVLKYSTTGNLKWKAPIISPKNGGKAVSGKVVAGANNRVYLSCSIEQKDNLDMALVVLDNNGQVKGYRSFAGSADMDDFGSGVNLSSTGGIFLTGKSTESQGQRYTTLKYTMMEKPNGLVYLAGQSDAHHFDNQVMVSFSPEQVDTNFVNNKGLEFASLQSVIAPALYQDIERALGERIPASRITVVKVHNKMTTHITNSITRLAEEIEIPKFWSTILLLLPPDSDEGAAVTVLETLYPKIEYAHLNHAYKPDAIPNDHLFVTDQESLFPVENTFPDADINVEPAWDIEVGQTFVKVGVYDDPIYWAHEDFGDGTFAGSKIAGGWDFFNNHSIELTTDPLDSHGTACGGIIGALRNNGGDRVGGIAGIAGGDVAAGNTGVQLFSLAIAEGGNFIPEDVIAKAIIEGATSDVDGDGFGYGLHIMSNSWGGGSSSPSIERAIYFCFRNQVVFVASRGNGGSSGANYPASHNDDWVVSVGASGTNGQYKSFTNGDIDPTTGISWWESSFGGGMDLIAPGVGELVTSTINPSAPVGLPSCSLTGETMYDCFNGTSAAAPHVAGVAALMYSLYNTNAGFAHNLAPEDVESILQESAVDVVNPDLGYGAGYDEFNGWGLLEANTTLQRITPPDWCIFHNGAPLTTTEVIGAQQQISLPYEINGLAAGIYTARRYTITHTYTDVFGSSTTIHEGWRRNSSTIGYSSANPVSDKMWEAVTFTPIPGVPNIMTVTATTNTWFVMNASNGQQVNKWLPAPPAELKTAYSLHLQNCTSWLPTDDIAAANFISISPNPTTGNLNIQIKNEQVDQASVTVFNSMGVSVLARSNIDGTNSTDIDLSAFPAGIYLVQVATNLGQSTRKVIKL
jgi:subtilisin family serine protease